MVAMNATQVPVAPLDPEVALFRSRRVRQARVDGETLFHVADVLARLDWVVPPGEAAEIVRQAGAPLQTAFFEDEDLPQGALGREDVLRVVSLLDSQPARRVQAWLVERSLEADRLEGLYGADESARDSYRRRGESEGWILARQHTRGTRRSLVAEWNNRGTHSSDEFRLLTDTLFEATFGLTVGAFRMARGLPASANVRDHLSAVELSLVELAESLAGQFARESDARGIAALAEAARRAGEIVGVTRRALTVAA